MKKRINFLWELTCNYNYDNCINIKINKELSNT